MIKYQVTGREKVKHAYTDYNKDQDGKKYFSHVIYLFEDSEP